MPKQHQTLRDELSQPARQMPTRLAPQAFEDALAQLRSAAQTSLQPGRVREFAQRAAHLVEQVEALGAAVAVADVNAQLPAESTAVERAEQRAASGVIAELLLTMCHATASA
ncbi:MAG: hypothetical protein DHS20C15_20280 [Planctomycetota bacterium]|nr:MAG: hypothetical protein DHS20C15_20280 [Planctomycetota bacterium]